MQKPGLDPLLLIGKDRPVCSDNCPDTGFRHLGTESVTLPDGIIDFLMDTVPLQIMRPEDILRDLIAGI